MKNPGLTYLLVVLVLWLLSRAAFSQLVDRVDVVEVNTVLNGCEPLFTQVIWWDEIGGREHVVAWRLCRDYDVIPRRHGDEWVSRWNDRDGQREVWARLFRQSAETFDVEIRERALLPQRMRRGLRHGTRQRRRVAL